MKDGRGLFMVDIKKSNIRIVRDYIEKHPDALKVDISRALKMSPITVRRHLASIESEKIKAEA